MKINLFLLIIKASLLLFFSNKNYFCTLKSEDLKKFCIILLSCMLLLPSFGSFFTYFNFKLNQEEIAKTICVQRKMVFNSCNGRCELQKSLKKYTDNEKRMQNNLKEKTDLVYVRDLIATSYTLFEPTEYAGKIFTTSSKKTVSFSKFTFRPPSYFI